MPLSSDRSFTPGREINLPISNTTPTSLSSFSVTAFRKEPHCVSLKKSSLTRRGYKSFEDWNSDPNHVYIGRDMTHHISGALGSKWGNPFKFDKKKKNSRKKCLERYEEHIRKNPDLFNAVMELEGKELGCWCKPSLCHGDILIKLFKERQGTNQCLSDTHIECERNSVSNSFVFAPLRLNGGYIDQPLDSSRCAVSFGRTTIPVIWHIISG